MLGAGSRDMWFPTDGLLAQPQISLSASLMQRQWSSHLSSDFTAPGNHDEPTELDRSALISPANPAEVRMQISRRFDWMEGKRGLVDPKASPGRNRCTRRSHGSSPRIHLRCPILSGAASQISFDSPFFPAKSAADRKWGSVFGGKT
ncbi:hypothetical protein N7468_000694 [Penicillium chermesinum]|uniref:Uncharacterized protein n=1 Tax=Penicillium chermesinum TaxID=63820 RepID=A0A9W9TYK8_9EURO|nr:uncharacterized protein N7468_000694 [Penicillium chermesinum]KAJ5249243.1 hypothetical protein N7468_000694 [Penicillium chermesinum]